MVLGLQVYSSEADVIQKTWGKVIMAATLFKSVVNTEEFERIPSEIGILPRRNERDL
jgi:hypothetical protein